MKNDIKKLITALKCSENIIQDLTNNNQKLILMSKEINNKNFVQ
jgi:hypothetical protein